ncbi:MAG: hypothetical protein JGK24_23710 [Microcoleus sp. PH2017_29_MFU_D_A]|jgi:hypothetical protein|uniref:hypothetical protein n=1 Tax=unclassified Microcoleus TaxID=2642155 RepID=UPI001DED8928|nr:MULTISPECIES: hypothetical protein [unclassified Microcoleus]MCC3421666.1 hypothetical protein [Microcoleus sp. PH2017_07_MST_O_A]MCC3433228.1 hypothetical protein [Microcoleus sp. PH2017_04_SCI_O_A]MCC3444570.1 hypothetical protein [Microcoleus sp. PH2017_03_ELD_O_A]MCC3468822.1 hypothetical protein [Microcoleus sp. PH2017_06_SFM_O_A]MCC3507176.1 hypothetical protein [Microcoleus sp. PH2017_19_SFW_U_A]MCC3507894.1 hypothetical protein [Microcoleus sp. PH2017_17_BER_D_A]TAE11540.1 MAG: hy
MNKQPRIPDPETSKRLLANLRRTRMEVQEVNLELGEINTLLAEQLRLQRLNRVRRSLNSSTAEL